MIDGMVRIAAGIRKKIAGGHLEHFEALVVSRLALLAHILIRSGGNVLPDEAQGVAREAIERIAQSIGLSSNVVDVVDYGIILVLIAIHACRQMNVRGDDVLVHVRQLLVDAANAIVTITPLPSPDDSALVMDGANPASALLEQAIEKLRGEVLSEIPRARLAQYNILSSSWTGRYVNHDAALQRYLLMDADQAPPVVVGGVPLLEDADHSDGSAIVLDYDHDSETIPEPADSTPADAESMHSQGAQERTGAESSPVAHDDKDDRRCLQEILAALAKLQDGQYDVARELCQLKDTIEEASGAFARPAESPTGLMRSAGSIPKPEPPTLNTDWRRMRKAHISEINFEPAKMAASHDERDAKTIWPASVDTDLLKVDGGDSQTKPSVRHKEIEIEQLDDWSDADRNQPSYRPSIATVTAFPAKTERTKTSYASSDSYRIVTDLDVGALRPNQRVRAPSLFVSARDAVVNTMSDEPLLQDQRMVQYETVTGPDSDQDDDSCCRRRSGRSSRPLSFDRRAERRRRDRREPRRWSRASCGRTTETKLDDSDSSDARQRRRHRSAFANTDDANLHRRNWGRDAPAPLPFQPTTSASMMSSTATMRRAKPDLWYGRSSFASFPDCCLNLPWFDLSAPMSRHVDCRYCQIERLRLRFSACHLCP